jgi:NAD(P)-dependent dehydrogenase (short-subunit alcohol dehydrogenase family)
MTESPVMLLAGGTGLIGRVIAAQALAAGWRVALHGRSAQSVEGCISQLAATGPVGASQLAASQAGQSVGGNAVCGFQADIQEAGATEQLVAQAAAWAGRLDAVVDCVSTGPAGVKITGAFAESEPHGYAALLDLSVAHVERLAHAAMPWLKQRGGTFIAFASDAGRFAAPRQALVGASRAAIIGFVRNLAVEVARDGVRVHCISPSFVVDSDSARRLAEQNASRMEQAAARAGLGLPTAADIAPAVLFLCGEGARKITGQVISINGGLNA